MSEQTRTSPEPAPSAQPHENPALRYLTQSQTDESWALAGIIEREIKKSGTFREKLGDYAYAFARSEKFDAMKADTIIRDQFKARYGQSMNALREELVQREESLDASALDTAHARALEVGALIQEGPSMPFYRAYDDRSVHLAGELNITESGAKRLMQEAFREREGGELYDWGKQIEEEHYRPDIDAPHKARARVPAGPSGPRRSR